MTSSGLPPLVATLRRLMEPVPPASPHGRCELCAVELPAEHRHVVDAQTARLLCACPVCADPDGRTSTARYRPVPNRYRRLAAAAIPDAEWEALSMPVDLAFFLFSSRAGRIIGFYPGPAGITESPLRFDRWPLVSGAWPIDPIAPDVEALLLRRTAGALAAFVVPIDAAYELAGRIRSHWTGWDGGDAVRREIDGFFAALIDRSGEPDGDA